MDDARPSVPLHISPEKARELGRAHTLVPARGAVSQLLRWSEQALEATVARVSKLADRPVYETADFPWAAEVERYWPAIRAELDQVMVQRQQLPDFHQILDEVRTITQDDQWKTFWLLGAGMDCRENASRCPQTMRALSHVPGVMNAFFSILAPGKHIPPHRGAYNGILRYHLGLIVPEPNWMAGIRIADQVCHWSEGTSLIFDDSFNHEAWNHTDGWRVVLFVDFARPLHQPFHWLNRASLIGAGLLPLMRRAAAKQRKWQLGFYEQTSKKKGA